MEFTWIPGVFKTEREVLRGINKKVSTDKVLPMSRTILIKQGEAEDKA